MHRSRTSFPVVFTRMPSDLTVLSLPASVGVLGELAADEPSREELWI